MCLFAKPTVIQWSKQHEKDLLISVSMEEKKTYKSDIKFTAPQKSSGMYDRRHGDLESMTCPKNKISERCFLVYINI